MKKISSSRLNKLFDNFKNKRIAVLGDLMLDSYMWGTVRRISPEAPVPVVEVNSETLKLGGAANVANNIINLGSEAVPIGVVGNDPFGDQIRKLFEEIGVSTESIITDPDRPTTIKTRIIAHEQHVVRADIESKTDISSNVEDQLLISFSKRLQNIEGVILQDYNKGVITSRIIREVVKLCRQRGVFTAVDPKYNHFFEFKSVDLIKPNHRETEEVLGIKIHNDADLKTAAHTLFERLRCKSIIITLGRGGMTLFPGPAESPIHVPTRAAKIYDVSGAGDTVIATTIVSKVAGASLEEAVTLANYAAGIVCGEVGVVPIERERLATEVLKNID